MSDPPPAEPLASATVVLLRDDCSALQVLLLKRSRVGASGKSTWVFPGGKVDAVDQVAPTSDHASTTLNAAIRETHEEAGLVLERDALVRISRWITPEIARKRFDTEFFCSALPRQAEVQVDGFEIVDHRWLRPEEALDMHHSGEVRLPPPTFVTVTWLTEFDSAPHAVETLARRPLLTFRPRLCPADDGACMLYPGDAGYDEGQTDAPGPRHRLWALASGYRYERTPPPD